MKITADNIGVDAGLIMVADISYAKDVKKFGFCKKELERLGKTFEVPNGKYMVRWIINNTWNGNIEGVEEITVNGGAIFICDPLYPIGKDTKGNHTDGLGEWLEDTDFGKELHSDKAFIIDSMGGDGEYTVNLILEKIS